jgi:ADP-ribosylglycohydrolase
MNFKAYQKKLRGCFIGKAVGGTLGMPFEGDLSMRKIDFYTPVPTTMAPNDDLDFQVIALEIIRSFGLPVNRYHLSGLWEHVQDGGPDEYGSARWNTALGRLAPLCGFYCNKIYAGMGAAIRSELWACLAPGSPALSVKLSREDACTDHYADGMEACMFLSAIESAAFSETVSDDQTARKLITVGLSFIPEDGRLAKGIRFAVQCIDELGDPYAARERFIAEYSVQNWTDVTINLGLIVISWLASGGDFSKGICIACGLGYDTDCTCATLGSIIGIIAPDSIGEEWLKPIGDQLVLTPCIMGLHEPDTIGEFCDLVADTALQISKFYGTEAFTDIEVPDVTPMHSPWTNDIYAVDSMECPHESLAALTPLIVRIIYPEYVAVQPKEESTFEVVLRNTQDTQMSGSFHVNLPAGWKATAVDFPFDLAPTGECRFAFGITPNAMEKKRPRDNNLLLSFTANGIQWEVCTDIPVTIPWEQTNLDTGAVEQIESRAVFQSVPSGHFLYRTAIRVDHKMSVRLGVFSNRAFKVKLDGEEVISGDGSYYVPALHRGKTSAIVTTNKEITGWNILEIEVMDGEPGELFVGIARPHGCCEWLIGAEYSLNPLK